MGREAVELDDQPSFRPEKVGLIALDPDAGHGPREPMPLDQLQEPILELRARPLTRANARQQPSASPARVVLNDSIDGIQVEALEVLR
ncbi:MAG TPA: hypothetical protein VER75_06515, partial [Thermoleophilaceae bacterium]|nr:hypothetical protein [Thermoleophilaceae bacterium]